MIDLDAKRAARREAKGKGPEVKLGGKVYELAPEMPFGAVEALKGLQTEETAAEALVDLTRALLGEHYEEMRPLLCMDDVNEFVGGIMEEYGVNAPLDSSAS